MGVACPPSAGRYALVMTELEAIIDNRKAVDFMLNNNYLGWKLGQFWGEVELFGVEASPAPHSLEETLLVRVIKFARLDIKD